MSHVSFPPNVSYKKLQIMEYLIDTFCIRIFSLFLFFFVFFDNNSGFFPIKIANAIFMMPDDREEAKGIPDSKESLYLYWSMINNCMK